MQEWSLWENGRCSRRCKNGRAVAVVAAAEDKTWLGLNVWGDSKRVSLSAARRGVVVVCVMLSMMCCVYVANVAVVAVVEKHAWVGHLVAKSPVTSASLVVSELIDMGPVPSWRELHA